MDTKSHKIAGVGVLVALAMVLSYLESLIPISLGIPGIKLGLSNVVTLFALYQFGGGIAFGVAVCRIVLCGVTFGSLSMMLYSFAGGLLSFAVMFVLKKTEKFSIYGISIAGGVMHNVGQLLVAAYVMQTAKIIYYMPVLLVAGTLAGAAIGIVGAMIYRRIDT